MFELKSKTLVNREFNIKELFKIINAHKDFKNDVDCIESITLSNVINVISEDILNIKADNY
ncbi:hypothetical protein FDG09_02210 [Clostridium sporogenes]|uniref:hypothetical protein n=1 Tax=Clostridium sporogenes TaxID=1509 RepID=UPI0013D3FB3E|nr:hypothetical protein [Clostridium sporogenes]NFV11763.1 hypothetical protein [Clostridium sporogenes]